MMPGRRAQRLRRRESGFALLLVFAMAAAVAVMLYMGLPRVAFEAQRNKEELLIERGEQYKRAIQLYFRKFKTYPPSIDALENTNNIRFLRRRYADPLTGKDDWRLIHVGPGGVFTDSLTQKPKKDQQKKDEVVNTFITEAAAVGSTLADARQASAFPPRRPSEGGQAQPGTAMAGGQFVPGSGAMMPGTGMPPSGGMPATGVTPGGGMPMTASAPVAPVVTPGQPDTVEVTPDTEVTDEGDIVEIPPQAAVMPPPAPGQATPVVPGNPNVQGNPQPGAALPGYPQPQAPVPGMQGVPGNPFFSGAQQPGTAPQTGAFGQPLSTDQTGMPGQPAMPGQPGMFGQPGMTGQPGVDPNQANANQAAQMIQNLLTRPRPFPGTPNSGQAGFGSGFGSGSGPGFGQQIGGGIAGVASKVEKPSIKIYHDFDQYNLWEFIYDFGKDRTGGGQMAGTLGAGDPRLQQQNGPGMTSPLGGQMTGFGGGANAGVTGGMFGGAQPGTGTPGTFGGFGSSGFGAAGNSSGFGSSGFGSSGTSSGFGSGFGSSGNSGAFGSSSGGVGSGIGGQAQPIGGQPQPVQPPPQTSPPH